MNSPYVFVSCYKLHASHLVQSLNMEMCVQTTDNLQPVYVKTPILIRVRMCTKSILGLVLSCIFCFSKLALRTTGFLVVPALAGNLGSPPADYPLADYPPAA